VKTKFKNENSFAGQNQGKKYKRRQEDNDSNPHIPNGNITTKLQKHLHAHSQILINRTAVSGMDDAILKIDDKALQTVYTSAGFQTQLKLYSTNTHNNYASERLYQCPYDDCNMFFELGEEADTYNPTATMISDKGYIKDALQQHFQELPNLGAGYCGYNALLQIANTVMNETNQEAFSMDQFLTVLRESIKYAPAFFDSETALPQDQWLTYEDFMLSLQVIADDENQTKYLLQAGFDEYPEITANYIILYQHAHYRIFVNRILNHPLAIEISQATLNTQNFEQLINTLELQQKAGGTLR